MVLLFVLFSHILTILSQCPPPLPCYLQTRLTLMDGSIIHLNKSKSTFSKPADVIWYWPSSHESNWYHFKRKLLSFISHSTRLIILLSVIESRSHHPRPRPHHLRPRPTLRPKPRPNHSRPRPPLPRPRPLKSETKTETETQYFSCQMFFYTFFH